MRASPSASSCPAAVAINSFVSLCRQQLAGGPVGAVLGSVAAMIALMREDSSALVRGFSQNRELPFLREGKSQSLWCAQGEQKLQKDAGL